MEFTRLEDLVSAAVYAKVVVADGFKKKHPNDNLDHVGKVGTVENRGYDMMRQPENYRSAYQYHHPFSVKASRIGPSWTVGSERVSTTIHRWVYPYDGDVIVFFNASGRVLGWWDGEKISGNFHQTTDQTTDYTDKEGARALFTPQTVKRKDGYQAQVTFNGDIIWEGTTIHKDDEGRRYDEAQDIYVGGKSGQEKARTQAEGAVTQAVEALFAKVKEQ